MHSHGGAEVGGLLLGTAVAHAGGADVDVRAARLTETTDRSMAHFTFAFAEVREVIAEAHAAGLRVVGWCHTHPGGEPFMSDVDMSLHGAEFAEAWHISIVGSVAAGTPMVGIWHLTDGVLEEVTEYATVVAGGLEDERRDARLRATGRAGQSSESWSPRLLGTALAIVGGAEAVSKALQTTSPAASSAERWRAAIANAWSRAEAVDPGRSPLPGSDEVGLLDRVGLVAGGFPVVARGLPLSGESDVSGSILCALDRSRVGVLVAVLDENVARRVVLDLDCYPWMDIAVDGDSAWLISTRGEVARVYGLRGCLDGHTLTAEVVDVVTVGDDPRLHAAGATCAIMSGPTGEREMVLCGAKGTSVKMPRGRLSGEVVAAWGDTLATAHLQLASQWTLRSVEGHDLATWDLPQRLAELQVRHVAALPPRVILVCDDPSSGVGIVLELEVGNSRPVALWLRSEGGSVGRAFPLAHHSNRVLHVDDEAALSLHPGCGG